MRFGEKRGLFVTKWHPQKQHNRPGTFSKTDAEIDKDILISKNQIGTLTKSVKMASVREELVLFAEEMNKEFVDQENEQEIAISPTGSCYYRNSLFVGPQARSSEHLLYVS